MAGQQQQIIDCIFNMKRKMLRGEDSSDSDEAETLYNQRKYNLKRKVKYARGAKSELSLEPLPYKKRIEHAGYHRYILQRNPPRSDPDGDIVEYGDEYEDEDDLSTVEENPYADIKLEALLAPLTSAAELPTHPSMSIPYTSKHLTNLTAEAGATSRKEQASLWRAKNLFAKFLGDVPYVPDSLLDTSMDRRLSYGTAYSQQSWGNNSAPSLLEQTGLRTPPSTSAPTQNLAIDAQAQPSADGDIAMEEALEAHGVEAHDHQDNNKTAATADGSDSTARDAEDPSSAQPVVNGESQDTHTHPDLPSPPDDDASETASQQTSHRMTTRARAQAISTASPPSSPSSTVNSIHPLFTFPTDLLPDRDFGLPSAEAEDTRMLLLALVQKQEEIARAANDLHKGMLQGEKMRQEVFKWAKSEAHVGEMSDGEDWYDREEWGLDDDLVKGRDEEEDDTVTQAKKSTRRAGRRADKEDR